MQLELEERMTLMINQKCRELEEKLPKQQRKSSPSMGDPKN